MAKTFAPSVRDATRLEQSVVRCIEKVATSSRSIVRGHVVIEPAERQHRGIRHHVRIHLTLPDEEILVTGKAIREAFALVHQQLRAYERRCGRGRRHAPRPRRGAAPVRANDRA
jgi:hypothetical protein